MINQSKWGLLLGAAIMGQLVPAAASAQAVDDAAASMPQGELGEIVVTARKRNERMIDVPETITAFSDASLAKAGITNIDKLGQSVPNVVLSRRGDNEPNVVIRGIGSFGNVQGIGFYIDDVQNFTDQASRLVDLERVEGVTSDFVLNMVRAGKGTFTDEFRNAGFDLVEEVPFSAKDYILKFRLRE